MKISNGITAEIDDETEMNVSLGINIIFGSHAFDCPTGKLVSVKIQSEFGLGLFSSFSFSSSSSSYSIRLSC